MSENGSSTSMEEIGAEEIEEIEINEIGEESVLNNSGDTSDIKHAEDPDTSDIKHIEDPDTTDIKHNDDLDTKDAEDPELENLAAPSTDAVPAEPLAAAEAPQPESNAEAVKPDADVTAAAEPSAASVAAAEQPAAAAEPQAAAEAPAAAVAPTAEIQAAASEDPIIEVPRAPAVDPPVQRPVQQQQVVARSPLEDDDGEEDDDDIDETLTERLIGLTEMFPASLCSGTMSLVKGSWSLSASMYGFTRSAAWIFFSTASILFLPVMIETERLSILDQQKQQKTQMLLGPGVATSGAPSLGPPPI